MDHLNDHPMQQAESFTTLNPIPDVHNPFQFSNDQALEHQLPPNTVINPPDITEPTQAENSLINKTALSFAKLVSSARRQHSVLIDLYVQYNNGTIPPFIKMTVPSNYLSPKPLTPSSITRKSNSSKTIY
ncbi:hypothetical protein BDR26DRAFT_896580 [Obelidium mucronatum]|nr:hypothetical protein BDR26DRAFT_896580 [Obelidium mucronatum]